METLDNLILNTNTLLENIILYAIPIVLVLFTLFVYSGIINKLNVNMIKIVSAIIDFLEKLESKKFKLSLLIITIIYLSLVIIYFIVRSN